MTLSHDTIAMQSVSVNFDEKPTKLSSEQTFLEAESVCTSLDLFSTTQTSEERTRVVLAVKDEKICINNAPYFAVKLTEKSYGVMQGCCNDWNCPKCGEKRAKAEYGRIIEGCREIAKKHAIYFITLTCRGADLSLSEAEDGYYSWTNRLLTACRTRAKREKQFWTYVQVTERQQRGHPHSHVLTTWRPHDLYLGTVDKWQMINGCRTRVEVDALRSDWLKERCISAGLGDQYDISKVDSVEGASRYVAKYLFKESMFTTIWRKGWKRVRYAQSFPKLPAMKTDAMPLVTEDDWQALAKNALVLKPINQQVHDHIQFMLMGHDIILKKPSINKKMES